MKYFAGIDPGKSGGAVLLSPCGQIVDKLINIQTGRDVLNFLNNHKDKQIFAYCEKAQAFPGGQGIVSTFNYGQGYGEILGILQALNIPFELIPPTKWTRVMFAGVPVSYKGKDRARIAVSRLFPGIDLRASSRCQRPHEGLVDALLIAEYGRRIMHGKKAS